jgi:LuxR family transcriptional regulator, maltose regulon positive regulatory protein
MPRPQLVHQMRASADGALVLVHGPAGFGKTTAMLQHYAQSRNRGIATGWLTLDPADNDLGRFLTYLIEAFREIDPNLTLKIGERGAPVIPDGDAAMLELVGHLSSFEGEFVLFLDEFEVVENPVVLGLVRQFLEYLPEAGQLVVGSRTVPELGLGRLRAHGRLVEIKADQLRFSSAETASFLRHQRGLALRDDDIFRLQNRTEGWPAALWLVSLALRDEVDPGIFVDTFDGSNASIADYLVEDVLARQCEGTRRFLLHTSLLHELSAPLCDYLLETDDSHELLTQIERAHLFLVPIDHEWYRYHTLFAGFLRNQLRLINPKAVPVLNRRAAQWWLDRKRPTRAIEHALLCDDSGYLMELLSAHAGDLVWQGRARTLARWYAAPLVAANLAGHPALMLIFGWALTLTHRYDESVKLLDAVDAMRGSDVVSEQKVPAVAICAQRAFILAMTDRVRESSMLWRECVPQVTPAQPFAYAMLGASFGYCLVAESRFDEARRFLEQARRRVMEIGDSFIAPMALCLQGAIDFAQGRLENATASFRAALVGGAALLPQASSNTVAAAFLAEALYEHNELDEAQRLLGIYLPVMRDVAAPDQLVTGFATLVRIAFARGDHERAAETLVEMEITGHQHALPRMVATARLERARIALLRGQLQSAQIQILSGSDALTWAPFGGLVTHANDTEAPFIANFRLRLHSGKAESAIEPLKQALKDAVRLQRHRRALKLGILMSAAQCVIGQTAAGLRRLRDALQFAASEGFMRSFLDEGPFLLRWVAELRGTLAEAPGEELLLAFTDRLLAAGGYALPVDVPPPAEVSTSPVGALSARELRVLGLLAGGRRNREIAERLFVSETTVKAHLRNINVKLGTQSRTHAIAVARQLGLVA